MPYSKPAEAPRFSAEKVNGSLLLIYPLAVESVNTEYGDKPAVKANVVVLDGSLAGTTYPETLIFPTVLVSQTREDIGGQVLGRLGQGNRKAGQKPPWKLMEATLADEEVANAYLAEQENPF